MRDVGKYFTVNAMLAKDSVKRRIESEEGITYTEFSYSLLQAYDYLVLFDRFRCTLQMGGSDQWGNITAGMDLVRRLRGAKAHGLVLPLVTTASGTKFGKTEAGTVWLDPQLTRPYEFYQFWLNVDDRDAVRYLKFFTFMDQSRIAELEAATVREPEKRHAQRALAGRSPCWCTVRLPLPKRRARREPSSAETCRTSPRARSWRCCRMCHRRPSRTIRRDGVSSRC
jgi:tyrosyl-tRNA synthetase